MRTPFAVLGAIALSMVIVGCGSSNPGASGTPGATLAPGATATLAPITTPGATSPGATTAPTGVAVTGHECDAVPTFSISNPNPSFAPDAALLAKFPTSVDGQPVTNVQALPAIDYLCLGGQAAFDAAAGSSTYATMSWGSFTANVDGTDIDVWAFRQPGGDGNQLAQTLAALAAASGNAVTIGQVTTASVGGKSVYTWNDASGNKGYAYVSGDTLIGFDDVSDSQANKILAALP